MTSNLKTSAPYVCRTFVSVNKEKWLFCISCKNKGGQQQLPTSIHSICRQLDPNFWEKRNFQVRPFYNFYPPYVYTLGGMNELKSLTMTVTYGATSSARYSYRPCSSGFWFIRMLTHQSLSRWCYCLHIESTLNRWRLSTHLWVFRVFQQIKTERLNELTNRFQTWIVFPIHYTWM